MDIGNILKWLFKYILYPAIIVCILYYIYDLIKHLVYRSGPGMSFMRRVAAAALPFISLVFLLLLESEQDSMTINAYLLSLKGFFKFLVGVLLGIQLVGLRKYLRKGAPDITAVPVLLFLSTVGSFILYAIIGGYLPGLRLTLFGMVLAGGIVIMFAGLIESEKTKMAATVVILVLLVNAAITTGLIVMPDCFLVHDISKQIEILELEIESLVKKDVKPTEREEAYIELLQESLVYPDIDEGKFNHAIEKLEALKATDKIPVDDLIQLLEAAYPRAFEGARHYAKQYRSISLTVIELLIRLEAEEACDLLYDLESESHKYDDKVLHEAIRKAAKDICGH
jgi:hypothetical protein